MNYLYRIYLYITKFFYYGYYGTKCHDFDASCIHDLIYAHMKRVNKFMHSKDTHLVWNDSPDTKGMKRLREFVELSKRMHENELRSYYFMQQLREKYPEFSCITNRGNPEYRKELKIALKKDGRITRQLTERYYHLLKNELPSFWD